MNGELYIVATPIGNLNDITIRALETLKNVDYIAAEDTRHTLKLLNYFDISKPLISYYKENEKTKSEVIIEKLEEGKNIALVSDAGTPGISDPGEEVIKKAIERNIKVIPIPGACAAINAIICSGFSTKEFEFIGFLSAKKSEKVKKLEELKYDLRTLIIYEAPHKLETTLNTMLEVLGDRNICIARELTKIHEEFIRGKISEILNSVEYRGECVILVEGAKISKSEQNIENLTKLSLDEHYKYYEEKGFSKKEIVKQIAKDRKLEKNEVYQYFLDK